MRVDVNITSQQVEIDIDPWEVFDQLFELPDDDEDDDRGLKRMTSVIHRALEHIPDSFITKFGARQQAYIYEELLKQVNRWKPQEGGEP